MIALNISGTRRAISEFLGRGQPQKNWLTRACTYYREWKPFRLGVSLLRKSLTTFIFDDLFIPRRQIFGLIYRKRRVAKPLELLHRFMHKKILISCSGFELFESRSRLGFGGSYLSRTTQHKNKAGSPAKLTDHKKTRKLNKTKLSKCKKLRTQLLRSLLNEIFVFLAYYIF